MRASGLIGVPVVTTGGSALGRLVDVVVKTTGELTGEAEVEIAGVAVGRGGLARRFALTRRLARQGEEPEPGVDYVPWAAVSEVTVDVVTVDESRLKEESRE
jgi:sporulation protein YlmC with PRC-barrel domain